MPSSPLGSKFSSVLSLAAALVAFGCSSTHPGEPSEAPENTDAGSVVELDPSEQWPGGETTNTLLFGVNAFSNLVANAQPENEAAFFSGNSFFSSAWVEAPSSTEARDGLGPLFNARSCAACHLNDGRGRPPLDANEDVTGLLLRIGTGARHDNGAPEGDTRYGDQLQPLALDGVPGEGKVSIEYGALEGAYADGEPYTLLAPTYVVSELNYGAWEDLRISGRVAPAMIGLGLLEAISEARLLELSDPDDRDSDGISGKINRVWDVRAGELRSGRFGWKAEQPSIEQQTAGAFLGDMGITSSLFPDQNCTGEELSCQTSASGGEPEIPDDLLLKVVTYGRLLAVPAREHWRTETVLRGKALFAETGCATCHVPRHETGDSPFSELSHQVIWPYTDLLLHDMGEALSDARPAFDAEGAEWRTPPLWGIGRIEQVNGHDRLLHDGRARGVAEAILWHAGEGEAAKQAFEGLGAGDRSALVQFVESL